MTSNILNTNSVLYADFKYLYTSRSECPLEIVVLVRPVTFLRYFNLRFEHICNNLINLSTRPGNAAPTNRIPGRLIKKYFYMGQSSSFGLRSTTIRPVVIKIHTDAPGGTRTRDLRVVGLPPYTARLPGRLRVDWVYSLCSCRRLGNQDRMLDHEYTPGLS